MQYSFVVFLRFDRNLLCFSIKVRARSIITSSHLPRATLLPVVLPLPVPTYWVGGMKYVGPSGRYLSFSHYAHLKKWVNSRI